MTRYLARRTLSGLFIMFVFVTVVFFGIQLLLPGDFVSHAFGMSLEQKAEIRAELGLDQPLGQAYLRWLSRLLRGDLGRSMTFGGLGEPVIDILLAVLPVTLLLFGIGTALAFMFGLWLGKATAWRGPGLVSGGATFSAIMLYTAFPPWLTFLLSLLLITKLGWFTGLNERRAFMQTPAQTGAPDLLWTMVWLLLASTLIVVIMNVLIRSVSRRGLPGWLSLFLITAGWITGWQLSGIMEPALLMLWRMALPILAYFLLSFGEIFIIMRTNMVDTLHEEYIQTARAKGLPPRDVRDLHAGRSALLPVLSRLVISLPYLMTGMVMIEESLAWTGIGTTLFYAVGLQNVTLGIGTLIIIGLFSLVARLILDVLVALLDPRIRHASAAGSI